MKTPIERLKNGPVRTEARRLARNMVKAELKRQGIKVSHVESSDITKAAYHCLHHPDLGLEIVKEARREVRNRSRRRGPKYIVYYRGMK